MHPVKNGGITNQGYFASHAAQGKPTGNADACRARSCSLFTENKVKEVRRMPKFKSSNIVELNIPAGNGRSVVTLTRGHIDFWAYQGVDLSKFAASVVTSNA
jgi:hypothetical protein